MTTSKYERLEQIRGWDSRKVADGRVVVVGCGALGNEVAKNLALVGWGTIILVDFDHIEESNLSRSVFFRRADCGKPKATVLSTAVMELNPDCHAIGLSGDVSEVLSEGLVARSDLILGCVDNVHARLILNRLAGKAGRPYIDGGLSAWQGTVSVFCDPSGPCYACGLDEQDLRELNLRRSCPSYAARVIARGGVPTTPTIASTVAAEIINLALKWVHGQRTLPTFPISKQMRWDQAFNRFWKVDLPRNPNCYGHPSPIILRNQPFVSWDQSWSEILMHCKKCFGDGSTVQLSNRLIVEETDDDLGVLHISGNEFWLSRTPKSMGLPCWSWLSIDAPEGPFVVELQGSPDEFNLFSEVKA
jgi:adenylyltransferase/sulfurtransferase